MQYDKALEKLGKWIAVIRKSFIAFAGVEAIVVIIIGVASSNLFQNSLADIWLLVLIIFGLVYLFMTFIKVAYNKSFPSSIIEELQAKKALEISNELAVRKDAINMYISNTVLDLSKCKSNLSKPKEDEDWRLNSDEDLVFNIKSLMKTFNSILNVLLNTSHVKFSTGVYLHSFRGINNDFDPENNSGTYLIRDEFTLEKSNQIRSIFSNSGISNMGLEIQNALKTSFNNAKFHSRELFDNDYIKATIICANIQDLKNSEKQKGVLFIITKPLDALPDDIESVLNMFTNIFSHWLDLYENEVKFRHLNLNLGEDSV